MHERWNIPETQFWLRGERPEAPVAYDTEGGYWNVYGYAEVQEILGDPATYSSDTMRLMPKDMLPGNRRMESPGFLTQMDPPDHSKLRKLVSKAFTPKVVADLEPRIAALTHELLDAVEGSDRMELVADLAYPLPVIVIAELLGVPAGDRHLFKQWVDVMFERRNRVSLIKRTPEQERELQNAMDQVGHFSEYLEGHAAERRKQPRDDLLTKLVEAEVDGERLADAAVVNFALTLLIAGHITTTMLLGNTVLCLDAHPEEQAKARADRATLPAVIEESLRFLTPFAVLARSTTRTAELGGVKIEADQVVRAWMAVANRDPAQFADPDVFDPGRGAAGHVAFGRGIHFCLGAPLARLEGRIALNILFDRIDALRTDPDDPAEFISSPNMTGVRRLPLLL